MARLAPVSDEQADPTLAAIFQKVRDRGLEVPNLYRTLGHSPRMLQAWIDMFWPLRYDTVSPRGLRELVIMRVAQLTDAVYEWSHHWPMAVGNGVRADQLRQLGDWESSDLFSDVERVALRYADGIIKMNVDDATFDAVRQTFSPAAIIELTLTASLYTNLARLTQALDVDLEPKYEEFARELGKA